MIDIEIKSSQVDFKLNKSFKIDAEWGIFNYFDEIVEINPQ